MFKKVPTYIIRYENRSMLQNPPTYSLNPLSHFLALQSTQAALNQRNNGNANGITNTTNILTNFSAFNVSCTENLHGSYQRGQDPQQAEVAVQQQPKFENTHISNQNSSSVTAHTLQHTQFLDSTSTTIDMGKSFTIAAILGLQNRNSPEQNHLKDGNSVINLSLNVNNGCNIDNLVTKKVSNKQFAIMNESCHESLDRNGKFHRNGNNTTLSSLYSPIRKTSTADTNVFITSASQHGQFHEIFHHQIHHQHHQLDQHSSCRDDPKIPNVRPGSLAAAAVAAVVTSSPNALQSLQHLHQHHSQKITLNFSHEKLKSDNHAKKSSLKNKRVRTIFTPEQLERLESEFERQQYMVGPERLYLAHTLQLTEAQVKVWFQNRRIKWRKHHLEFTQQRLALLRQSQVSTSTVERSRNSRSSPDGLVTAASNSSFGEIEEPNLKDKETDVDSSQKQQTQSDSELSVCNDSNDSIKDCDGNT